jgi:pimeloyl-ACP methyl ester carboxylesterase
MRIVRVLLIGMVTVALLVAVAIAAWAWRQHTRDPLAAVARDPGEVRVVGDAAYEVTTGTGEPRIFRDLVLATEHIDTIRLTISAPRDAGDAALPLVFILAGLRTGRESLGVLDVHGHNLLVGYEYPYDPEDWERGGSPLREIGRMRRAILNVPVQVGVASDYLAGLPEVDARRRSLLGYSLGALFVPAAQRLAMYEDAAFGAVILAYAGVDLRALIQANLRVDPPALRSLLARLAATVIAPLEPAKHLPHLTGRFLVIRGDRDSQIPAELSQRLADLTPEPRRVITLDAGHMGPRDPALTATVVRLSQEWLVEIGAIDLR